jgi:hypothetical protein
MKVTTTKVYGGIALDITCKDCGEPVDQISESFGMDCKNHCGERAYMSNPHREEFERNMKFLMSLFLGGG